MSDAAEQQLLRQREILAAELVRLIIKHSLRNAVRRDDDLN